MSFSDLNQEIRDRALANARAQYDRVVPPHADLPAALAEALRQRDDYRDRLESAQREIARLKKGWERCKRRLERITEPEILREDPIRQAKLEEALREAQLRGEFKRGL